MFDLALGWTLFVLYAIAAGFCTVLLLALGYRLNQMREDRQRRENRLGYIDLTPFRRD